VSKIEPGIYVHYKSDDMKYDVIGLGVNSETHEEYVIYRPLYKGDTNPDYWVRPYKMFVEKVEVNGKLIPRFRKVDN
jgi:hypothetical protein